MKSEETDNKEINLSEALAFTIKEKINKLYLKKYPFDILFYPSNRNEVSIKSVFAGLKFSYC